MLRLLLFAMMIAPIASMNTAEGVLPMLVAAERAFAADAQASGVHEAFVTHLDENGWIFRPQPVRAGAWLRAHPNNTGGKLEWKPEYAEIAASGDFGYTFGPWRAEGKPGDDGKSRYRYGHFFSVWKREAGRDWKNVVDHGIVHGAVSFDTNLILRAPSASLAAHVATAELERRMTALVEADNALNVTGGGNVIAARAAPGLRYFRDGTLPTTELAVDKPATVAGLKPIARDIAASGDLAYTLGARADGKTDGQGGYVRVWRYGRDGWQLVTDMLTLPD